MSIHHFGFFQGCATAPTRGPVFSGLADGKTGYSILYLYRPYEEVGSAVWPEVFINESKVVSLVNQGYTILYLKPGIYNIRTEKCNFITGLGDNITAELNIIKEGEVAFLKFDNKNRLYTEMTFTGFTVVPTPDFENIHEKWIAVEKNKALVEIKNCRYVTPYVPILTP